MLFKEPDFFPFIIRKQFGNLDYLSYIGGSLGLLVGISLLSLVEVIYYSTLHVLFVKKTKRRVNRVEPRKNVSKLLQSITLVKQADVVVNKVVPMEKSSVHSMNIIADVNKSIVER